MLKRPPKKLVSFAFITFINLNTYEANLKFTDNTIIIDLILGVIIRQKKCCTKLIFDKFFPNNTKYLPTPPTIVNIICIIVSLCGVRQRECWNVTDVWWNTNRVHQKAYAYSARVFTAS